MKTIYLLDGTANIFRAFYAIRHLTNDQGLPTNATYGFTQMLRKLLGDEEPEYLAVAFDRPEPTLRHQLYPEYKANRMTPPEDLIRQIPDIKRICEAMGVAIVETPGYEADDLIGTLAARATMEGFKAVVVSSDKDLFQLVNESTEILNPVKAQRWDREGVRSNFGVYPEQVVEVLALMGDSSDNIPGVPGIGEKGAKSLVQRFETLEGCLEHAVEISRKTYRENLVQYQEQARLSRDLARIRLDAPVTWDPESFRLNPSPRSSIRDLFRELGFQKWIVELDREDEEAPPDSCASAQGPPRIHLVRSPSELETLASGLEGVERLALVPLFTNPLPMQASLVGLGLAWSGDEVFYLPLMDSREAKEEKGFVEQIWALLEEPLASETIRKVGQDLKSLQVYLGKRGLRLGGPNLDTTLAAYLLEPERRQYTLPSLQNLLASGSRSGASAASASAPPAPPEEMSLEEASQWTAPQCRTLLDLDPRIVERLEERGLSDLYLKIEGPLLPILAEMEGTGVRVDTDFLKGLSGLWGKELANQRKQIFSIAGEEFNIQSPQQLREILFGKLGLKPGRKTQKEKSYSTGLDVLEDLARNHPLPAAILEYRSLAKLLSTYVEALPKLVHPETGRVHTSFNQTAAATGRLSSSHPNLQNIPIRTERGRQIRRAFVAEEGWRIVTADYSQIELRVLAHLSGDAEMTRAFRSAEDIHSWTAAEVFGVSRDLVTSDLRRQAKAINFGILYGMGPFRLGRELGVSLASAKRFIERYFERFAGVKRYVDSVVATTEQEGQVATLFGRIRPVPEILSRNANTKRQGIRVAVNTAVQGTAADLIKKAMVRLHRKLTDADLRSRLLVQVHDELVLESPPEEVTTVSKMVKEAMENCHQLDVPLVAEVRTGKNWLEIS